MIMRKVYFCCIFFLWLNLLEACRASSRKSDQDQSCQGKCWQNFNRNDPCHCNSQCQNHNNCCDDFVDHCFTCQNKCGNSFNRNYGCQCNDGCTRFQNCCPDYHGTCSNASLVSSENDIKTISNQLFELATRKQVGLILNLQGRAQNSGQDNAPENLINRINSDTLLSGTYEKLVKLLDNYNPAVTIADEPVAVEVQEQQEFLDELFKTDIIRDTYDFLKIHGYVNSRRDFRRTFEKMWFEPYDRDGNSRREVLGSSGFEHVFVGERKGNKVSGFHGWVYFYKEEQDDHLNYLGYKKSIDFGSNIYGMEVSFKWNGKIKPIGSAFFGTPPELDLALYTICAYAKPNASCRMKFGGKQFRIQTYIQNGNIKSAFIKL